MEEKTIYGHSDGPDIRLDAYLKSRYCGTQSDGSDRYVITARPGNRADLLVRALLSTIDVWIIGKNDG